jgi:hypothetical protein
VERLSRAHPEARAPAGGEAARPAAARPLLGLALVLAAAFALHAPALRLPFFADDFLFLDQARHHPLLATLTAPDPIGNFYRPVGRQLYFWLLSHAGAESPRAAHAVNLGLLLVAIALLHDVARRLAGARAALVAAALVALHYASDVPVRWASGSQDLLAVTLGLAALSLHLAGRRFPAAAALLLAALSKEVVLLTPLVALLAARRRGEPWRDAARRAWPLGAAIAAWALIVLLAARWGAARPAVAALDGSGVLATFVHLAQVAVGLEWGTGGFARPEGAIPPPVPLLLVVVAVVLLGPARIARGRGPRGGARPAGEAGVRTGLAWALAGAVPIVAVASIWSAYYYLFAVCGAALALGAWLSNRPRWMVVAVLGVLACGSARSASLEEFALVRRPWTARSHLNRFYMDRATLKVERYLGALRAARPELPARSTLFFAGLPGGVGFQSGDGALVRHAYRDSSLRAYYLGEFDLEKARRGPVFFFEVLRDTLREAPDTPERGYLLAASQIMVDRPGPARALLEWEGARSAPTPTATYWLAWLYLALGDRPGCEAALERAGFRTTPGPAPEVGEARAALAAGDTLGAVHLATRGTLTHAMDPAPHGLAADLLLSAGDATSTSAIEAYAARVLAPGSATAWRRWGMVQLQHKRYLEGLASFDRYFALAGEAGARDAEAHRWVALVRRAFPAAGDARPAAGR